MLDGDTSLLHATCIAIGDRAALILGPSGAGKSDLALRAISSPVRHGDRTVCAILVSDDQVQVTLEEGRLLARPPPSIAGRIEIRGVGIVAVAHQPQSHICLAVQIGSDLEVDRLPDPDRTLAVLGVEVPLIRLRPFEASAAVKLVLALARQGAIEAGVGTVSPMERQGYDLP